MVASRLRPALALTLALAGCSHRCEATLLVLGDSHAQFSGSALAEFCAGQSIVNRGVMAAMALHWKHNGGEGTPGNRMACPYDANTSKPESSYALWGDPNCVCANGFGSCRGQDAFNTSFQLETPAQRVPSNISSDPYTAGWLSIGGKDFLDSNCQMSRAKLATRISDTIGGLKKWAPANFTLLVTGYCTPSDFSKMPWYPKCTIDNWQTIAHASADAVAEHPGFAKFVDVTSSCGGGPTTMSPGNWSGHDPAPYHVDDLHYNNRGYCKIFTEPEIQSAPPPSHPICSSHLADTTTHCAPPPPRATARVDARVGRKAGG